MNNLLSRRGSAVITDAPDTGSPQNANATYAQEHGITKIQGSGTTFGSVSNGSAISVTVLPTGSVQNSNCSYI